MTSQTTIQTCSQSRALKEHQDALNMPSISAARDELMDEGEFLFFSNHHTPVGTTLPDPSTPTPALRHPYDPGQHSADARFSQAMYVPDYGHANLSGGGGGIAICLHPALLTSHSQTLLHPPTIPQLQTCYSYLCKQYRCSPESPQPLWTTTPLERPRSTNLTRLMVPTHTSSMHSLYYAS